jgi:feruloyl-CoA synthase
MPGCRPLDVASWRVTIHRRADGCIELRPDATLGPYPAKLTERLDEWAERTPEATFLAQRGADGNWTACCFTDFRERARRVAQGLLDRGLTPEHPIAILSGNSIEHALLGIGAFYAGIPYAPISPAYSLIASDPARLRRIFDLLSPGLVFADDGFAYSRAIESVVSRTTPLVVTKNPPTSRPAELFGDLEAAPASRPVDRAHAATGPDDIAKILFTSGSTGAPKGVITTHRMLASNQEMLRAVFPFLARRPPVICDWLPWHHTFGGSHNFGLALYNGGALYIDRGRPIPEAFEETVRNLREIAPTVYFNVPKGFEMLNERLACEPALRSRFFSRLEMAFFAAAGLPQHIWDEFDRLAVAELGARIPMLTGLGATETAPLALCAEKTNRRSGVVGLPVPGVELKLAPVNGKHEARVRGPNVTPGFWRQPELTRAAFDEEGYYRLGDALRFIDAADPAQGLFFDGRLAEDFKLSTGTWVSVGPLRTRFILHCAPHVRDVVIAGEDRDEVTALIFPDPDALRRLGGGCFRQALHELLRSFAHQSAGSSNRIARAAILADAPSIEAGEVTDKGSINQRAVLARRAEIVERLYMDPVPPDVLPAGDLHAEIG